jgi:nucleoside-diphosphate-sugar epimerase
MTVDNTRFTVLGADGFVGRHLARYLRARSLPCAVLGRDAEPDFTSPLGHVIYCIGLTADYLARPFDTVEAHVSLFSRILRHGDFDSLVYLSSTRLYDSGGAAGREEDDLILNPGKARHLYDFSKGLGEVLCTTCGNGKARVARLSCVYADELDADNFLHGLVADALLAGQLTVDTHPDAARDYVHVDDVCEALAAIALRGTRPIYNVASGTNIANRALFDIVARCTGCRIATNAPENLTGGAAPRIDISALRDDLGLSPRRIEDYLPVLIEARRPRSPARRAAV